MAADDVHRTEPVYDLPVRGSGIAGSFLAAAAAALAACAHRPADPPPKQGGPAGQIVVSDEFVRRGSKEALAAWLIYGSVGAVLEGSLEGQPEHKKSRALDDFAPEWIARKQMIDGWRTNRKEKKAPPDEYLDALVSVADSQFLEEYLIAYLSRPGWTVSAALFKDLDFPAYRAWAKAHLAGHEERQWAAYIPKSGERFARQPGSTLPSPETLLPTKRPCAETQATLATAVAAWAKEEATLDGAPLVAASRDDFFRAVEWAAGQPSVRERGVTWVPVNVSDLHYLAGFCANDRGDWNEAVRQLTKTAAMRPLDPAFRGELVHALASGGRLDDADREIERALALKPGRCTAARLWRSRGYVLVERKKAVEAYQAYVKSLELDPTSDVARKQLKTIVQMLQAAGSPDAEALSRIPVAGVTTTTVSGCRDE
jgi:tetratricopeptide (TPR) repeat protein